jgi:hypothetical protein
MSIEAMKQALEALENNRWTHYYCEDTWYSCPKHEEGCANDSEGDECNCGADKANAEIEAAIASLRQAIEQAEKQEPVAWMTRFDDPERGSYGKPATTHFTQDEAERHIQKRFCKLRSEPLYAAPPRREWVGLTDEEVEVLASWWPSYDQMPALKVLIKDVTNSLKEKNS